MTGVLDALYKRLLLAAHPVGSVYQSTVATSPESLFGGTWEEIRDVFLLAAGTRTAGNVGGEETHTLTVREMPSHAHHMRISGYVGWGTEHISGYVLNHQSDAILNKSIGGIDLPHTSVGDLNIIGTGGNAAHNNMPPYLTIYMWKRTA